MIRVIALCFVLTGCMTVHVISENGDNDKIDETQETTLELEGI